MKPAIETAMSPTRQRPATRLAACLFPTLILLLLSLAGPILARTPVASSSEEADRPSFVDDFLILDKSIAGKYSTLAKAIPDNKLDWRPSKEARSITEVLTHIAQTNFGVAKAAGLPMPEDMPTDWSKVKEKDTLVELIDQSFGLLHQAAEGARALDMSKPFPGQTRPSLRMLLYAHTEHHGEHLGQLIAYARSVGVKPPWSR